jgi:hypothetical protein
MSHPLAIIGAMCDICDGKSEDEVRLDLARKIDTYGWAIQGVEGSARNEPWAYTIGLVEHFGHPELVVTSISLEIAGLILNQLAEDIRARCRFVAGDGAIAAGVHVNFAAVHPAQFDFGVFNTWFDHYRAGGPELSALQVLLPPRLCCGYHAQHVTRLDQPWPPPALNLTRSNQADRRAAQRRHRRRGRMPRRQTK